MQMIAREHDVWVLTSERCREGMEAAVKDGRIPRNVRVHYAGPPFVWLKNKMAAKLKEWPYYRKCLDAAYPIAQRLHCEVGFDLVHHVTFASWRVGVPFWRLGIPTILGPIGGGESFDLRFLSHLSLSAAFFEIARIASNWKSIRDSSVRSCLKNCDLVLTSNPETTALALKGGAAPEKVKNLLVTFFPQEKIRALQPVGLKEYSGPLRIFAAGALEGRKGVGLALKALRIAKDRGIDFSYQFTMGGPESEHLKRLSRKLGLEDNVVFSESLPRPEYENLLKRAHIYLLPSLRDNSPSALMEAMLCGCVPIVADCGGPSLIVSPEAGLKIPVQDPEGFIASMSEAIALLDSDRHLLARIAAEASRSLAARFSEDAYWSALKHFYADVT
ncbi:MAG: glycosyltransferase [Verrucomicrobiaceae bacterium]|nr:MAG: glycosyltransferase [Verrucomicrobiaceae bacterium]